jgi:putative nucleotidyltransferase with HDIG domain
MPSISTEKLIEMAPEAIPLPATTLKIIKLINDPRSTADDVGDVLEMDQALTARVLRVANSAYYGVPRQVASAKDAVVMLGHNTLRSLIFTASVAGVLGRKATGYALGEGELWRHSVNVAGAARLVARVKYPALAEEAYVAGLLLDIGKIVLDQYMQDEFETANALAIEESISFIEAEQRVFGADHAEIGGLLAEKWNLPPDLVDAIRHHHDPSSAEGAPVLAALVHVSDLVATELGIGIGSDGLQYPSVGEAFELAGIDAEEYMTIMGQVAENADEAANQLN